MTEGNGNAEVHCAVCKRPGARWGMRVDGGPRHTVHKPCGKRVAAVAPEGRKVKIFPTDELRREWDARDFWADKFKEAQEKRDAANGAKSSSPPPGQPSG